jgi:hypothetical protein
MVRRDNEKDKRATSRRELENKEKSSLPIIRVIIASALFRARNQFICKISGRFPGTTLKEPTIAVEV